MPSDTNTTRTGRNPFVLVNEEIKKHPRTHVKKTPEFLGVNLSQKDINSITDRIRFTRTWSRISKEPVPVFKGKDDSVFRKGELANGKII